MIAQPKVTVVWSDGYAYSHISVTFVRFMPRLPAAITVRMRKVLSSSMLT